ncbi:hypothetical protein [Serratia fonticola]
MVDIYEIVYRCIQQRENNLVGMFMLAPSNAQPSRIMTEQIAALKMCIEEEVPTFKQANLLFFPEIYRDNKFTINYSFGMIRFLLHLMKDKKCI